LSDVLRVGERRGKRERPAKIVLMGTCVEIVNPNFAERELLGGCFKKISVFQ
jgi:hypothetical protein